MSPSAWPPSMSRPTFWPSEPPAGLGPWGRQTEHRLRGLEQQMTAGESLIDKLQELEAEVAKLKAAAAAPAKSPTTLVELFASQNFRLALALGVAALSFVVTGKLPDLSTVLGK